MSEKYSAKMTQVATQFAAVIQQLKSMNTAALEAANQAANQAGNADKLEGLSLNQVVELIAGSTGLTIAQVQGELNDFIATVDDDYGSLKNLTVATNAQADDDEVNNALITPLQLWRVLNEFWASKSGMAPETLDTIEEIAAALQNNPDVITAIQDQVANKATKAELAAAVDTLNAAISGLQSDLENQEIDFATTAEAIEGTNADKAINSVALKAVRDEIESDVNAAFTSLEDAFTQALADLQA